MNVDSDEPITSRPMMWNIYWTVFLAYKSTDKVRKYMLQKDENLSTDNLIIAVVTATKKTRTMKFQ